MIIQSYWYGAEDSIYARMARVLEYSASRFHSNVRVTHMPDKVVDRSAAFVLKARDWTRAINEAGDELTLLDCDMYVRSNVWHVFDIHMFDIAVTRDGKGRLNSGVLFVRPSAKISAFFYHWQSLTAMQCEKNTPDSIRFGDQDALEGMLKGPHGLNVLTLPMRVYNSTQRTWAKGLDSAKIVHVKSDARKHIERGAALVNPGADKVVREWQALEAFAQEAKEEAPPVTRKKAL